MECNRSSEVTPGNNMPECTAADTVDRWLSEKSVTKRAKALKFVTGYMKRGHFAQKFKIELLAPRCKPIASRIK